MLDCGVDESYSLFHLNTIAKVLADHHVDYLLLSNSALTSVGALPYLQKEGKLDSLKIMSTSPTCKMASLTMYEYFIQRKELSDFHLYSLYDVEKAFERVELVSFNEHRKLRGDDVVVLSGHPSGSAIGGTCWKVEYNKQHIVYAQNLNDVPMNITVPMMRHTDFKSARLLITNGYHKPRVIRNAAVQPGPRQHKFLSEDKLRAKLEKVLVEDRG
jgi:cleavage and polyadenylation specificity factor subunit 2